MEDPVRHDKFAAWVTPLQLGIPLKFSSYTNSRLPALEKSTTCLFRLTAWGKVVAIPSHPIGPSPRPQSSTLT